MAPAQRPPLSTSAERLLLDFLADGMVAQIVVTGTSMAPFIRERDLVTLEPIAGQPIGLGDVVAFERPGGRLILHRVVALTEHRVQTRGDAATEADEWTELSRLSGRLIAIERAGRPRHLGLGGERAALARLSALGLLAPVLRPLRWLQRNMLHSTAAQSTASNSSTAAGSGRKCSS
ncbi:MAG: S24/S26 family peptidase [Acidobacteriota bacterium]